ncbi:MAG TPA: hypothetical protein VEA41_16980 [Salinarimonas sp.]|nr:hypothetical protein [Salinarimonas sp.]
MSVAILALVCVLGLLVCLAARRFAGRVVEDPIGVEDLTPDRCPSVFRQNGEVPSLDTWTVTTGTEAAGIANIGEGGTLHLTFGKPIVGANAARGQCLGGFYVTPVGERPERVEPPRECTHPPFSSLDRSLLESIASGRASTPELCAAGAAGSTTVQNALRILSARGLVARHCGALRVTAAGFVALAAHKGGGDAC